MCVLTLTTNLDSVLCTGAGFRKVSVGSASALEAAEQRIYELEGSHTAAEEGLASAAGYNEQLRAEITRLKVLHCARTPSWSALAPPDANT